MGRFDRIQAMSARRGSRAGLLLALAALLGQVWIAAPHATQELVSALAPASQAVAVAHAGAVAGFRSTAQHHDPGRCPVCQASSLARSTVTSSADVRPLGIFTPTFDVVAPGYDHVPAAPADPNTAPRAPPA
jgi:hypothetical protein